MAINFYNSKINFNLKNKRILKAWIQNVIQYYNKKVGDINYIFTSEEEILEINKKYLNHNYFTDIITFPYIDASIISADIYICIDIVESNAKEFNQKFYQELNRVLVHGVLHMLGYNDHTNEEQLKMRETENFWLEKLNESLFNVKRV